LLGFCKPRKVISQVPPPIRRLLNPSALFEKDRSGAKVQYLRAEVGMVEEPKMEIVQTTTARELIDAWDELRLISERLEEPRFESNQMVKRTLLKASSWQIAGVWQKLQIALLAHREKARAHAALHEWIARRQSEGRLPRNLPQLDAAEVPQELLAAVARSQGPQGPELGGDFWTPLLKVLAAGSAQQRRSRLLALAQEEVRLARARTAIRELLG